MSNSVTWSEIQKALVLTNKIHPEFLESALIVGGGASLFYNLLLTKKADKAFPPISPSIGQTNFSHDIDFTHVYFEDYRNVFKDFVKKDEKTGKEFIQIKGVRFGFLQFGCTFVPEEETEIAKKFKIDDNKFHINVLHPASLYREKTYLIEKGRGKLNDEFHRSIAKQFCLMDYHQAAEEKKESLLSIYKDKAFEIFSEITNNLSST